MIEDDYDAEFRYDRAPLGALQGLAPDRVVYMGTVSKTLAPGAAARLAGAARVADRRGRRRPRLLDDLGCPTLDQLVLARLLETAAYDRHLRRARRRNRARRDALIAAVARAPARGARQRHLRRAARARAPAARGRRCRLLIGAAASARCGVYPLELHRIEPAREADALVLGYANLSEPAIDGGRAPAGRGSARALSDARHAMTRS